MVKDQPEIKRLLDNLDTRQEGLLALGEWVFKTCLLFGTSIDTAYQVAAILVGGVKRGYEGK